MGQDAEREQRLRDLEPYRIDDALLALADRDAVAMHCLPAHVGEEIAADVLYGPRCLAWEQAENRLHTQKALMALVIRMTFEDQRAGGARRAASRSSPRRSTNVAVVVEDENPDDPDLLGLYHGVPLPGARRRGGLAARHDLDLPHPARGVVSRIPAELRERDPHHRAARARATTSASTRIGSPSFGYE